MSRKAGKSETKISKEPSKIASSWKSQNVEFMPYTS
jgi:hypothetical protein